MQALLFRIVVTKSFIAGKGQQPFPEDSQGSLKYKAVVTLCGPLGRY